MVLGVTTGLFIGCQLVRGMKKYVMVNATAGLHPYHEIFPCGQMISKPCIIPGVLPVYSGQMGSDSDFLTLHNRIFDLQTGNFCLESCIKIVSAAT